MLQRSSWPALALLYWFAAAGTAGAAAPGVPADITTRLLAIHNLERSRVRVAPLQWDPQLAVAAASYGPSLARSGRLQHSPRASRPGQRENLWMGTRRAFSPEQMVGTWIDERRHFRPGVYPDVSKTGNWYDVSHYSQLIWKGTTRIGCAIHSTAQWDYLICRYSPPGNVDGWWLP